RFCFTGNLLEHEPNRQLDSEIERTVWLDHSQLHNRNTEHRSLLVKRCLEDYLRGQRFDLSLLQAG
ncbi:MAG: NUDIX hydrolase, partial [Thioalkalispiraceae bacterium]